MIEIEQFITMDLDDVCTYELQYLDNKIELLITARLCDPIGKAILAEYGFKGTKEVVISALNDLFEKYAIGFTEEDRQELIKRKERYNEFFNNGNKHEDDAVTTLIKQHKHNMEAGGISNILNLTGDFKMMRDILHDQKMCLCYNNH
jgi:hypothetical protein